MSHYFDSLIGASRSKIEKTWIVAIVFTLALHLFVFILSVVSMEPKPLSKARSQVKVQTIQLSPFKKIENLIAISEPETSKESENTAQRKEVKSPEKLEPLPEKIPPAKPVVAKESAVPIISPAKPTKIIKKNPQPQTAKAKNPAKPALSKTPTSLTQKKRAEQTKPIQDKAAQDKKAKETQEKHAAEIQKKQEIARKKLAELDRFKNKQASSRPNNNEIATLPKVVTALQVDAPSSIQFEGTGGFTKTEINYRDKMEAFLKGALRLPEFGEVEIKLTLSQKGKVTKVTIVKTKSVKNSAYIERTLPNLIFPPFDHLFEGASEHTFTIMLHNG